MKKLRITSQGLGIGVLIGLAVLVLVTLEMNPVPEHETIRWKQDSIASARDSIRAYYDSVRIARAEERIYWDSVYAHQDSVKRYWKAYYDSVFAAKEEKRRYWDSIKGLKVQGSGLKDDSLRFKVDGLGFKGDGLGLMDDSVAASRRDSLRPYVKRIKKDTIVELNSADTTDLMYIRGIGKITAVKIIRYREKLRGYANTNQITEIGLADSLMANLTVCTDSIHPMDVNRMTIPYMSRHPHPYLDFENVKAIVEGRRRKGRWRSLEELSVELGLDEEKTQRLKPYLRFE